MWVVLLGAILLAWLVLKARETFVVKYGNPFDGEDILSFDPDARGTRLFSTTPDTCPADRPVLDAGLCYPKCEEGYNGVGPVCWAGTHNRGGGQIPLTLGSCKDSGYEGFNDFPWPHESAPFCEKPLKCATGWKFFTEGCTGGIVRIKELFCRENRNPGFPDKYAGLCYRKCPDNKPRAVPGMGHLCFKGTRGLAYGRGVGSVPPLFHFGP
jgi:hypothetical protein